MEITNDKTNDRDSERSIERESGWSGIFLRFIEDVARTKSTCCRIKTAACLIKDGRIISTGYNGVPSKYEPHCDAFFRDVYSSHFADTFPTFQAFTDSETFHHMHHERYSCYEIHGEQNAISYAARAGIATKDTTMFTLYSPCFNCAKLIISAGVTKVYFYHEYLREREALEFLAQNNVAVVKIFY